MTEGGGEILGVRGLDPMKICNMGQSMFWPPKMSHFFHSKPLLDNSASFTSSTMRLVSKIESKTNFLRRLQAVRNRDCLEMIDVGYNLKQFNDLTWLTLTPIFYDSSTPLRTSHFHTPTTTTTTTTTTNVLIIVTLHKVAGALYISSTKNANKQEPTAARPAATDGAMHMHNFSPHLVCSTLPQNTAIYGLWGLLIDSWTLCVFEKPWKTLLVLTLTC